MGLYRGSPGPLPGAKLGDAFILADAATLLLDGAPASLPGSCVICLFTGQPGSDLAGEICETAAERAVMLDGGAQFLGARVFAVPGG